MPTTISLTTSRIEANYKMTPPGSGNFSTIYLPSCVDNDKEIFHQMQIAIQDAFNKRYPCSQLISVGMTYTYQERNEKTDKEISGSIVYYGDKLPECRDYFKNLFNEINHKYDYICDLPADGSTVTKVFNSKGDTRFNANYITLSKECYPILEINPIDGSIHTFKVGPA